MKRNETRLRRILRVAALPLLFLLLTAAARGQSALDGFDPNANGTIRVVIVQPDGKILLGGEFTSILGVARNRMARLNPDGTLDTAFDPNANSFVTSIAVQTDGKILVGGFFNGASSIGGQSRTNTNTNANTKRSSDYSGKHFNAIARGNGRQRAHRWLHRDRHAAEESDHSCNRTFPLFVIHRRARRSHSGAA